MTFQVEDGTSDAVAVVRRVRTGVACLVAALFFTADDFFAVGFSAGLFFAAGFFAAVASAVALLLDFAALFSAFAASFFSSDFDPFSLLSAFFATAFFVDFSFFATDFFESFCATLAPFTLRGGTRASASLSRIPVGGRRISFRAGPKWLA